MSEHMEFNEHREHAVHAAEAHDPLITRVSITIAVLAVVTAIVSSVESLGSTRAILESNKATLAQAKASDMWSFYQAKGIKRRIDEQSAQAGGPGGDKFLAKANLAGKEQLDIQRQARGFETERDRAQKAAELNEARHPRLTLAAAVLQISIAVSTVAIVTRRRWPWLLAMASGAAGALLAASAFLW
jgi:xanthine/uracil permease